MRNTQSTLENRYAEEAGALMLYACLERGKQVALSAPQLEDKPNAAALESYLTPIREALAVWRKGLQHSGSDADLCNAVYKCLEDTSVRAANEIKESSVPFISNSAPVKQWGEEMRLLTSAITVLQDAIKIAKRDRMVTTLSALYVERALSQTNKDETVTGIQRALEDYAEALKLSPQDMSIKQRMADMHNYHGVKTDGAVALRAFGKAIELNPNKPLYYRNRGVEYLNQDNCEQAVDDLMKAISTDPNPDQDLFKLCASACNRRGLKVLKPYSNLAYAPAHVRQEARTWFQTAMKLAPDNSTYRSNATSV